MPSDAERLIEALKVEANAIQAFIRYQERRWRIFKDAEAVGYKKRQLEEIVRELKIRGVTWTS